MPIKLKNLIRDRGKYEKEKPKIFARTPQNGDAAPITSKLQQVIACFTDRARTQALVL